MPTPALLRSFPMLAKPVLYGTFPRPGAFRPDEVQAGTFFVSAVSCDPSLAGKERLAMQCVAHSPQDVFATCLGVVCSEVAIGRVSES